MINMLSENNGGQWDEDAILDKEVREGLSGAETWGRDLNGLE